MESYINKQFQVKFKPLVTTGAVIQGNAYRISY